MKRLLIANRGEIAIRIARSAADLGLATVAVYAEDDALSLHIKQSDQALALRGVGPAPYLDSAQLIAAAQQAGCDAVHPGYGFLSEDAAFARRCADAGLVNDQQQTHPQTLADRRGKAFGPHLVITQKSK